MKQKRTSLRLEGEEGLKREALEVMLSNITDPAEQIVLKNTSISISTFVALRSYFESKCSFVLDLTLAAINDECLELLASSTNKNMACCLKALYL